jgi:hypothetical protein
MGVLLLFKRHVLNEPSACANITCLPSWCQQHARIAECSAQRVSPVRAFKSHSTAAPQSKPINNYK